MKRSLEKLEKRRMGLAQEVQQLTMCQCDCGQLLRRLNRRSTDEAIVLNQASSGGKTSVAVETVDDALDCPDWWHALSL